MPDATKDYYDTFSTVYENERHVGYHRWLDDREAAILRPYCEGKRILEAGCGTGLILSRMAGVAETAAGVDLSPGMLEKARERGLDVREADLGSLPFADESFDTVYSVKVLPHVENIHEALVEMARVTAPGGHMILEFYNPRSLRGLIKSIKPPTAIAGKTDDRQVYTRYDTCAQVHSYLPSNLQIVAVHGIRILTPAAVMHRLPLVGSILQQTENLLSRTAVRHLGGFLLLVARKN